MSNGKESDVVLNFKTNGEVKYSKTIKEINRDMNLVATEYKNQVSAMDKDATATEKLTAEKKKLEKQLSLAEQRTKLLREEYEKSVKETGEYSTESQKLYKRLLESETGENKLRASLEKTNDALEEQGDVSVDTAKKLQKIEEAGEKVTGVGEKMTIGLSAPIMAIGALAMASFGELDDALDGITTATGATGAELESLQESFKNVVDLIPAELEDIGIGIGEVNTQFGLTDEALESTTEKMLKFAEITGADVSQSTIYAKQSMELFRLSTKDLPMILDVVSKTSQDTGVNVDQLFDAVNKGAPQLKNMGLGFAESTTLIGQMEKAGLDTAGTIGYLAKANVNYAKDNKTMQEGLEGTIKSIKGASTEQEKLTIASEVFGSKAGPKMVEAIDSGALTMEGFADAAKNAAGTVEQTYEDILDPIDKVTFIQNKSKVLFGEIGEQIQIAFLPAFEKAIEVLDKVSNWFTSLSDNQKQTIVVIGGIVAAIGPFLVILGTLMSSFTKIVRGIRTIQTVFSALSTFLMANPFIMVIIGIGLLIAAFVLAYTKVKWFRDGVNAFFKAIKDFGVETFKALGNHVGGVFDAIKANFDNFAKAGKRIFNGFIDFITGIFTGNWKKAWNGVVDIFGGIFEGIGAVAKAPINYMIGIINSFIGGLNKIKIPKWVPGLGGKGFNINKIPYLAKGGHLINGQAIVGEAGPELLTNKNGKTTVTPLSEDEKRKGVGGAMKSNVTIEQHNHFGNVDANNPSELDRMNRKLAQANKSSLEALGVFA